MTSIAIHQTQAEDIPLLQRAADETGLFPGEILPDLLSGFLDGSAEAVWLTAHTGGAPVGFCFAEPEALTQGTWNMRALAVRPAHQGAGIGAAIVGRLEEVLRQRGARVLIADTSGTESFGPTRRFYARTGYREEARIHDFWEAGDDKVVFWKALR